MMQLEYSKTKRREGGDRTIWMTEYALYVWLNLNNIKFPLPAATLSAGSAFYSFISITVNK